MLGEALNGLEVVPVVTIGCRCISAFFFFFKPNQTLDEATVFVHLPVSTAVKYIFYWSALKKVNLYKVKIARPLVRSVYSY